MSKELDNEIARITGDVDALSELVSEMKVSAAGVILDSTDSESDLERPKKRVRFEPICCICGVSESYHRDTHRFFKALPEYKCVTCGLWFFEHDMDDLVCFDPYERR